MSTLRKFFILFLIVFLSFKASGQTVDFNQAENDNDPAGSYNIEWINGILNSVHTSYFEGMSVPQRLIFTDLPAGQMTLKIKFLAKKGDNHAYDFLTSWQQAYDAGAYYGGTDNELQNLFIQQCEPNSSVSADGQAVCASLSSSAFALNPEIPDVMGNGPFPASANIDGKITIYENSIKGATGFGNRTLEIKGSAAISNASVTFTGYDADFATYTIVWTNSAANTDILVRFAGHLAIGDGVGGYGAGLGAGSVNGGPYHFKFENLYDASNNSIFSGDQDNQIMSGAVQIAPICGFENGTRGCPETPSFSFDFTSNTPNTSVTFSFLSNTANATFNSSGSAQNSITLTTDGSGNATVTVYPMAGGFTAGGSFRIRSATASVTCDQVTSTVIESASVTASADPTAINLNAANHSSTLTALGTVDGVQDNSLFVSFTWAAVLEPGFDDGSAGLSSTSGATVTFTPTFAGSFKFRVTAVSATGCTATNTVIVTVTSGGTCPAISGPTPVCPNTSGLTYTASGSIPQFTHYDWSIVNNLATITSGTHDVTSITVTSGTTDFVVRITVSFDNPNVASFTCDYPVHVETVSVDATATPTTINLNAAIHNSTLSALGTVDGVQDNSLFTSFTWSAVLQPGFDDGTAGLSSTSGATVTFTPTFAGSFKFRVLALTAAGCPADDTVIVTVTSGGTCPAISGDSPVCAGSTGHNYSASGSIPQFTHYDWSIVNNLATITSGTHDVTSVTVTAGAVDFIVRLTVSFDNPNVASFTCDYPVDVEACDSNCSYTQGYFGGNGKSCDDGVIYNSPQEMLTHLLTFGDIVVGNGTKSVTIPNTAAGVTALYNAMPGTSTPNTLPSGNCVITDPCWTAKVGNVGVYLTKQGKINNVLLSQTITLILNSRLNNGSLLSFGIEDGILTTLARNGCDGDPIPGTEQTFQFNANVVAYLTGINEATVAGLLKLAEDLLGGAKTPGSTTVYNGNNYTVPTYAEVNYSVDVVNRAFDKCRASLGYSDPVIVARTIPTAIQQEALSVSAYPNPFTDKVKFTIRSTVAGRAQLDVYNLLGQKLQTVYNGYVQANMNQIVEYSIPARAQQNLLYILQVGNERLTGKLLKAGK